MERPVWDSGIPTENQETRQPHTGFVGELFWGLRYTDPEAGDSSAAYCFRRGMILGTQVYRPRIRRLVSRTPNDVFVEGELFGDSGMSSRTTRRQHHHVWCEYAAVRKQLSCGHLTRCPPSALSRRTGGRCGSRHCEYNHLLFSPANG